MNINDLIARCLNENISLCLNVQGGLDIHAEREISDPTLQQLKHYKAELIAYLQALTTQPAESELSGPILAAKRSSANLSFAQQRLWLIDQIDGGSTHYNIPNNLTISGQLDTAVLLRVFDTVIERHESLRTCFSCDADGQPLQMIQAPRSIEMPVTDLSLMNSRQSASLVDELIAEQASRPFDLGADLMLRGQLIKLADDEHLLLTTLHHITADGWSMSILMKEISELYQAYHKGQQDPLPPLNIQYADYAHWQRQSLQGDFLEQQLSYWQQLLADLPMVHRLPLDHHRPPNQTFSGDTYCHQLGPELTGQLNQLCWQSDATLFMGLHAAFSVLLSRYSNETDIVVGTPIANREQAEVADLIGFFVNSLVLRSDLSGQPSFIDLLRQSKAMLLAAYAHQQAPFEQIVERLKPERSTSHSPLFQIMLVLQNNIQGRLDIPGLTASTLAPTNPIAVYDLTLYIRENEHGLRLDWEYNTDLFEGKTIARMSMHFERLINALVGSPQESVFNVGLLTEDEQHQQLKGLGKSRINAISEACIHELFEKQAVINPDAIAVMFADKQWSYGELNARANGLAAYLINEKYIVPGDIVGLCVERSLSMLVGLLAILKAGAAYMPIDPGQLSTRIKHMITDSGVRVVLTQHGIAKSVLSAFNDVRLIELDDPSLAEKTSGSSNIAHPERSACDLAYVIYTSGSTGKPKAVLQTHLTMTNLVRSTAMVDGISASLKTLQFTPLTFDVSIQELVTTWYTGSSLVLISQGEKDQLHELPRLISALRIERLFIPPAVLQLIAEQYCDLGLPGFALKEIMVAGEALNISDSLRRFLDEHSGCRLWNHYGPTETHVATTMDVTSSPSGSWPAIGKPVENVFTLVLDNQQQLVPIGCVGELYIGGCSLATGYLNQLELTEEKFIENPVSSVYSNRIYKTGDLVRLLANGDLEYMGRTDDQVKIRGFRIELGEVEAHLSRCSWVKSSVVMLKNDQTGDKQLVGYVTLAGGQDSSHTAAQRKDVIRQELSVSLPDYLIPSHIVILEKIPFTQNGKVDRKALPEPDLPVHGASYIAPVTETEIKLCDIWRQVLGIDAIGVKDNFFQIGGHSLLAARIVTKLNTTFKADISLHEFFNKKCIELLAMEIDKQDTISGLQLTKDNCLSSDEMELTI